MGSNKNIHLYNYIDIQYIFLYVEKNTRIKIVSNDIVFMYPGIVRSIES